MSGRKEGITEEKMKKLAAGATVAGVLLVVFLVVILIVQFVQIGVANAQSRDLDREIAKYEELLKEGQDDLAFYESELGLYYLALGQGWQTPSQK